ncbi:uncharacterized protein TNCV_184861 [Trichonephila clavipes]|nr:uncharacterized protein TNCV_184861 [Trichonephila clavipes]
MLITCSIFSQGEAFRGLSPRNTFRASARRRQQQDKHHLTVPSERDHPEDMHTPSEDSGVDLANGTIFGHGSRKGSRLTTSLKPARCHVEFRGLDLTGNRNNNKSEANPQVYVETPLHPEKLFGALYGLEESFFKNDKGHNVTVNSDRYRAMITNFSIPELNNHDFQELWFEQDGATYHTARATIYLLKDTFGDRLTSRFGPILRVHYFVRGGFVGHRSRANSKHLSSRLPVDGVRFLGGQKGLRFSCKMHQWVSGSPKISTAAGSGYVTALALSYRNFLLRKV